MSDGPLSDPVLRLIADHIDSVVKLELLLLLRACARRAFGAAELAAALRVDPKWVTAQLGELSSGGIIVVRQGRYQFEPATPALRQTLGELADAYSGRPVSVIACIHGRSGAAPVFPSPPPRWP